MAHKKSGGSLKNNRDSKPKNLGFKIWGGGCVLPGWIILRQKGSTFLPGKNVGIGKDFTIYSLIKGTVKFKNFKKKKYIYVL